MSLVKQGHLELVDRTMSSQLFSISKSGNSNTSTGNLCQCSVTPKIEIEKRKTTCVVPMGSCPVHVLSKINAPVETKTPDEEHQADIPNCCSCSRDLSW